MIEVAVTLLSIVGLAIASYFTAVAYRWVEPDARWMPTFCRLDEKTCASVVFTDQARVFGPPNSVFGQAYYALLIGATLACLFDTVPWSYGLLAIAAVTVCLAGYLSYSLLWVLRVPCGLCFTSHAINIVIFALLLYRLAGN